MTYMICPECGHEIEDTIKVCPYCRYKFPKKSKERASKKMSPLRIVLCTLGVAFVVAAVIGLVINKSGSKAATNVSNKAISVGTRAVQVADDYLDSTVSAAIARAETERLCDEISYVRDFSPEEYLKNGDSTVYTYLLSLSYSLLSVDVDNTPESYDRVLQKRNDLSEKVGIKKRVK